MEEVRLTRALAMLAIMTLCIPSVLAASPFTSSALVIEGVANVTGPAAAIWLLGTKDGAAWEATAASVVIEREWLDYRRVATPVGDYTHYDVESQKETLTFTSARVQSTQFREGGAFLVTSLADDIAVVADSFSTLAAKPVTDPRFDQTPPPDVSDDGPQDLLIHAALHGDYVDISPAAGTVEVRGTFSIRIMGVDASVAAVDGTFEGRTGEIEDPVAGPVTTGRQEAQTLTLQDAVLRIKSPAALTILSQSAVVSFEGTLTASDPQGLLALPGLVATTGDSYAGATALELLPAGGALGVAAPPGLVAAGSARVAEPPLALAWLVGATALLAIGIAIAAVTRRRARGDDLELALLAMTERRWEDALPHLDRVVAKRPQDAGVIVDRAICLEEAGRLQEARAGYERALQLTPFSAEAHYYYARTLARLRMGTAALAHLSRALTLDARLTELAKGERAFAAFADHPQFVGLVR